MDVIGILGKRHVAEILGALHDRKVMSPSEIATALNLKDPQICRVLKTLGKHGLVKKRVAQASPIHAWALYALSTRGRQRAQSLRDMRMALRYAVIHDTLTKVRHGSISDNE